MSADGPPPLAAGSALAPGYRVLAHLSRGRSLDVYDVWSEERHCLCVAKTLRPDCAGNGSSRRRLVAEGELLLRLAHPHIVRAYELVRRPSQPVLVLEPLGGATLAHLIGTSRRRLPAVELAFLGLHLCSAIAYLHGHGVLHLDLKPSNVVSDSGVAKVIDLGIARAPGRGRKGIGTRVYMAPEQARGGVLSAATDVWGIGAVLFEAATGRRPFADADGDGYPQLERRASRVRELRRLPAPMAETIDACLEPAPGGRPTPAEVAAALDSLAAQHPSVTLP